MIPLSYIIDKFKSNSNDSKRFDYLLRSDCSKIAYYLMRLDICQELYKAIDEKSFDPSIKNNNGMTIWHYLAWSGNYEALCKAIDEKRFNPSIKDIFGLSIWHYLALSGNYEALCKSIDEKRFDKDIKTNTGDTIWYYLAYSGNYESFCKAIDEKRCDPSIKNIDGTTIWHYLAQSGNYEAFCKAIDEKRFDPSIKNNYGDAVWYDLANINPKVLQQAYDRYQFDISEIPKKHRHLIHIPTKIEKLLKNDISIDIPSDFIYSISYNIMTNPVVTEYGNVYDKSSIEKWLVDNNIDPLSGKKFSTKVLYPNLHLTNRIIEWLEKIQKINRT